jgi:hypothetical protein
MGIPSFRGLERALLALVVVLLLGVFFAGRASAATLFVTEFAGPPSVSVYYQAANAPALVEQTVAIGGASVQSAVFGSSTKLVRVHADVACSVVVGGTNPTATATSMRLAAGQTEYFVVIPGQRLAVIVAAVP